MPVIAVAEPLTPNEFRDAQQAAEEDEADHRIEQFETAEEWNTFVSATKATQADLEATETNDLLHDYEHLVKAAGASLVIGLAIEGAQAIAGRRN